jgi:hypothetical protein
MQTKVGVSLRGSMGQLKGGDLFVLKFLRVGTYSKAVMLSKDCRCASLPHYRAAKSPKNTANQPFNFEN